VFVQVQHRHVRALAREQHRDRTANAGIAAGDDRGQAFEFAAALVVRREETRLQVQLVLVAGFREVLLRQRILRLPARAGLHRLRFVLARLAALALVGGVDAALDRALLRRDGSGRSGRCRLPACLLRCHVDTGDSGTRPEASARNVAAM
jgi:hypothetical protein